MAMATVRENASTAPALGSPPSKLDWSHLRFFLELVRTGSHARAAKRMGVDRNTVARRVGALEAELGVALFERGPQGWSQTAAGQELAELAGRVEEDVLALARHVDARDRALRGTTRLTTVPHLAAHLLPPALPALRRRHPELVLEVVADPRAFDLSRREADLAVRVGRPRDSGLVTRRLSSLALAFYAAASTEAGGRGAVDLRADLFLGSEGDGHDPEERWLDELAPERRVVYRCNSTTSLLAAARHGLGVAVLPCYIADGDPALRRLDGPEPPSHELWLLVHGDLRRTPRVRAVIDWLDELVARAQPALLGQR
jgi:DNA-binding transcriptional LysR family regulator